MVVAAKRSLLNELQSIREQAEPGEQPVLSMNRVGRISGDSLQLTSLNKSCCRFSDGVCSRPLGV